MLFSSYCVKCVVWQAFDIFSRTKVSEAKKRRILKRFLDYLSQFNYDKTSPEVAEVFYEIFMEETGIEDPYKKEKKEHNEIAKNFIKTLEKPKNLSDAVKISVLGNILDYGTMERFSIEDEKKKVFEKDFAVFDINELEISLRNSKKILIIGDNAGEIVFDKILVEFIKERYAPEKLYYSVRGYPMINDATVEDAEYAEINKYAEIITTGQRLAGVVVKKSSKIFKNIFYSSDTVISKGQGNFETLEQEKRRIFFLFKIKCPVVAEYLKFSVGDFLLLYK